MNKSQIDKSKLRSRLASLSFTEKIKILENFATATKPSLPLD